VICVYQQHFTVDGQKDLKCVPEFSISMYVCVCVCVYIYMSVCVCVCEGGRGVL